MKQSNLGPVDSHYPNVTVWEGESRTFHAVKDVNQRWTLLASANTAAMFIHGACFNWVSISGILNTQRVASIFRQSTPSLFLMWNRPSSCTHYKKIGFVQLKRFWCLFEYSGQQKCQFYSLTSNISPDTSLSSKIQVKFKFSQASH